MAQDKFVRAFRTGLRTTPVGAAAEPVGRGIGKLAASISRPKKTMAQRVADASEGLQKKARDRRLARGGKP